jgi:predicted transcriptional regulator
MSKAIHGHVGDSLEAIGDRVVDAWRRAERGELIGKNAEVHIGFETWETMVRTLSPKRLNCCVTFTARQRQASGPWRRRSDETTAACMRSWRLSKPQGS